MTFDVDTGIAVARRLAGVFARGGAVHFDDLFSEALFVLAGAARRYRADVGCPFEAYVSIIVQRDLRKYVARAHARRRMQFQLIEDMAVDRRPRDSDDLAEARCEAIRRRIPPREFEVLWQLHAESRSQREVAARIGTSQCRVHHIAARAAARVRRHGA